MISSLRWNADCLPQFPQPGPAGFPSAAIPVTPADRVSLSPKHLMPHFGCRLFGFLSAAPEQKQSDLLEELVWKGQDSLREQSEKDPIREWDTRNFEGMWYGSKFPNGNVVSGHQIDGSGVVRFDKKNDSGGNLRMHLDGYKSDKAFYKDPYTEKLVQGIRERTPDALLIHVREASSTTRKVEVTLDNNHPFRLRNFALMHNGTLTPSTAHWLEKKIAGYHRKFPEDIPKPKGTVDSERLFLYLMGRIREQCGTLDSEKIPTKEIEKILQSTLHRLKQMSFDPRHPFQMELTQYFEKDTGLNVPEYSGTRLTNGLNIILSDGDRMFISRCGRNLRFTTLKGDDGKAKAAFVSSYEIQPGKDSDLKKLNWVEVPEDHMVTLKRNGTGKTIDCKIQPFTWPHDNWVNKLLYKASMLHRPPSMDEPMRHYAPQREQGWREDDRR